MDGTTRNDFRAQLRDETRTHHDAVDALFSSLDLGARSGMGRFVRVHECAFSSLLPSSDGAACRDLLADLVDRLRRDLSRLGEEALAPEPEPAPAYHPLAVDYVVEGSRLGTNVLRRRWEASGDPVVRAADAYFTRPHEPVPWRTVCSRLASLPPDGDLAADVSRSTVAIFELFQRTFRRV